MARIDIAQLGGILTSIEQESDVAVKGMKEIGIWVLWFIMLGRTPLHSAEMIYFLWYLRMYLNLKMRKNLVVVAVNRAAQNRTSSATTKFVSHRVSFKATHTNTNYFFLEFYVLLSLHPGTTPGKWPTWCIITLYKTFIIIVLYMFRATLCSSSGGQFVLIQHLV